MPESESRNTRERIASLEDAVRRIESVADPETRATCRSLVQTLMEYHAAGLERILEVVSESAGGQQVIDDLGSDELAGSLLILHGLHPLDLQARVLQGLEKARPYLKSHGGDVSLAALDETGTVTIRLEGSCHSCPSSMVTLQSLVEDSVYASAPDLTAIVVEGSTPLPAITTGFIPLQALNTGGGFSPVEAPGDRHAVARATEGSLR